MSEAKSSNYRSLKDKDKPVEVRLSNIIAAKGTVINAYFLNFKDIELERFKDP